MASGKDALAKIIGNANKKYGFPVGSMAEIAVPTQWISTGNMAIDYVFGGGIPLGRLTELAGLPSSGKTTTALQAAAELQRVIKAGGDASRGITPDDIILYFDYENAMDPEYAKSIGLDVDDPTFRLAQPNSLESGTNFALAAAETGVVRMMIFDSVAMMIPETVIEKDVGSYNVGVQAKFLTDFGNKMTPVATDNNVAVVLINHTKEKLGVGGRPGMPAVTTTPGGVGLKFMSSIRAEYAPRKQYKSDVYDAVMDEYVEKTTANDVLVKTVKNKLSPPYRQQLVRVRYGTGFDNFYTAVTVLLAHKKIMYSTGIYYFHKLIDEGGAPSWMPRATTGTKRPYIKGLDNLYAAAEADREWAANLEEIAQELIHLGQDAIPEDVEEDTEDVEEVVDPRAAHKVSLN